MSGSTEKSLAKPSIEHESKIIKLLISQIDKYKNGQSSLFEFELYQDYELSLRVGQSKVKQYKALAFKSPKLALVSTDVRVKNHSFLKALLQRITYFNDRAVPSPTSNSPSDGRSA